MSTFYKNWEEIRKIGQKDKMLMLVLASVNTDENDLIFAGLYCGFPDCFSPEKKLNGPFPLSVIRSLAGELALNQGEPWDVGANHPDSYEVLQDLGVPHILFDINDAHEAGGPSWPFFPLKLENARKLKQSDLFEWKGKQLIILEMHINDNRQEYWAVAAPVGCIAVDL